MIDLFALETTIVTYDLCLRQLHVIIRYSYSRAAGDAVRKLRNCCCLNIIVVFTNLSVNRNTKKEGANKCKTLMNDRMES